MSLPSYIRTEWKGRGHAVLKFESLNCKLCEEKQKSCHKENLALSTTKYPQSTSFKADSINLVECLHTSNVECLLSTFNVWEFEEQPTPGVTYQRNERDLQQFLKERALAEETLPPTISEEIWKLWRQHWEDWKDVYINLSWVERFKNLCNTDTVEWFNNYCDSYPHMLSFVSYCKDIELEKEENIDQVNEHYSLCEDQEDSSTNRTLVDELYGEFSAKRHWVHFRLFLRDYNFEVNEELKKFFSSHGINDDPPSTKGDLDDYSEIVQNSDNSKQNNIAEGQSTPIHITSSKPNQVVTVNSLLEPESKEHLTSKAEEQLLLPTDWEKSEMLKKVTIKVEDSTPLEKQSEDYSAGNGNLAKRSQRKSSLITDKKETIKWKDSKSKHVNHSGVAWALKHIQQLGEKAKSSQPDNASRTFVFVGNSKATMKETDYHPPKMDGSNYSVSAGVVRSCLKRKHEELESENICHETSSNLNQDQIITTPSSNLIVRAIGGIFTHFQYLLLRFSRGVFQFIMAVISKNPFQRIARWWNQKRIKEEISVEKRMERKESNLINLLKQLFKPTIRHIPDPPLMSSENVFLTQMTNCSEGREVKENLIKVFYLNNTMQSSQTDIQNGLYVMYMTEEDIDDALEDMVEPFTVVKKEKLLHRTLTIFDESGMPQDVIKVPVDGGKMRFMLEDDYKKELIPENHSDAICIDDVKERESKNWLFSNIHFDEGNPVSTPANHQEKHYSLNWKINRVLRNTHLMRFSEDDVYTMPEDIPKDMMKYWRQRFRLFLRYDEGIKLDYESWFSTTPEVIAAHQAERCACDIVLDAFCGAGGNAIQLAATCNTVIAIDIDPTKIALAQHNAKIYGVEDRIQFIHGDFFQLAPKLKADVVFLAPPWGGVEYLQEYIYDIFMLGGQMNGKKLFVAAEEITPNIAMYLPKNTNLFEIIELACPDSKVDVEFCHISNKRKSLTAYYGGLVNFSTVEDGL